MQRVKTRQRWSHSIPRAGVDQATYSQVESLAKQRNLYMSDIVRLALEDYLNRIERRKQRNSNVK